jgi:hypothetical protein
MAHFMRVEPSIMLLVVEHASSQCKIGNLADRIISAARAAGVPQLNATGCDIGFASCERVLSLAINLPA